MYGRAPVRAYLRPASLDHLHAQVHLAPVPLNDYCTELSVDGVDLVVYMEAAFLHAFLL